MSERSSTRASLLAPLMTDERLVDLLGMGAAQVQGDRCLHVDERHVVGHDVVQLLRDAQPVLAGPAATLLGEGPAVAERALAAHPGHLGEGQHEQRPGHRGCRGGPRPATGRVAPCGHSVGGQHTAGHQPGDESVAGEHGRDEATTSESTTGP